MATKRPTLLNDIKLTVTKTRQQAMQDISRFMKIKSMSELVDQDDFWTEQFENDVYYNKVKLPQLVKVMTSKMTVRKLADGSTNPWLVEVYPQGRSGPARESALSPRARPLLGSASS